MWDNVATGSAISSTFIIHFKQPTLHFHVVNDQLAENTNHLWSKQWHKDILHHDNIKLFLDLDLQFSYLDLKFIF